MCRRNATQNITQHRGIRFTPRRSPFGLVDGIVQAMLSWYGESVSVSTGRPVDCEMNYRTGWFKENAPNCVSRECRLQYLLECHIPGL